MTAQIHDTFRHRDVEFSVAGISEDELFDPAVLGLEPAMATTACWRGYQAVYAVLETHLVVADLNVNLLEDGEGFQLKQGPTINGVTPTGSRRKHDFFNNHYSGLNYHLEYSSGLLLAAGFIRELYVHMGFHPPWKYKKVIELVFENGVLQHEFDRTEQVAEIRQKIIESHDQQKPDRMPANEEIRQFVERAFDRSYRL